ncbi:FAFR293Cp [Eremothecium gossypii FDAG1]|nr:FAFR293Cp [Eremothecium gossypii FDAG1]
MEFSVEGTQFSPPVKRIFDTAGTHDFQKSLTMYRLQSHLERYLKLVQGQKIPKSSQNRAVVRFVCILERLDALMDETPPRTGSARRFGDLACRDWHDRMQGELDGLLETLLPEAARRSAAELRYYLGSAFGSRERLDYGTGHELAFLAVVVALDMLGLWTEDKFTGEDMLYVWARYYALVHRLILIYNLEPAGSHGVWGLDDHLHLAYILGASQWAQDRNVPMQPSDILDPKAVARYSETNLYCNSIAFLLRVKTGHFAQHSPMLHDIAQTVPTWSKVTTGLIKMYRVEVLNKFPVVQHFWFGTGFFPWVDMAHGMSLPNYEAPSETSEKPAAGTAHTTTTTMPPPRMTASCGYGPLGRLVTPRR